MRRLLCAFALVGCKDPGIEIERPADGARITTHDPIVFEFRAYDLSSGQTELYIDGKLARGQYGSVASGAIACNGCISQTTWLPSAAVTNGSHELQILCIEEIAGYDDTVVLVFERP